MSNENLFITAQQMAVRVGVSEAWLRREAEAHRIPALRAGRRLLFNPDAVRAALLARAAGEHRAEGAVADAR